MDVRSRLARQAPEIRRLARAHPFPAAPLHAGRTPHGPVLPRLRGAPCRRRNAARRGVPGDRRRHLRRRLRQDRPHARKPWPCRSRSRGPAGAVAGRVPMSASIALIGAGRMGRGLAVVFAYAGHDVVLIDLKPRQADQFARLAEEARSEVAGTLATLARLGLFAATDAAAIAGRVRLVPEAEAGAVLPGAAFIFEGVPEVLEQKRAALALVSRLAGPQPVIASTTSTILVDDLAGAIEHRERFMNAHWLNPPYLMPLVELSPGNATRPEVVQALRSF